MGKRHEAIGIKQAIRFDWMQKAANLLLVGLDAKTIRQEKLEKTGVITLDVLDPQRYILCFGFRIIRC